MQLKEQPPADTFRSWRIALWLVFLGGMLFFWPACLDRYLVPRFFYLAAALMVAGLLVWKDLRENGLWQLSLFDLLLLGWYGLNLASVSWAFSWSEGVFFAQKTLLLFLVYWFVKQALHRDENSARQALRPIISLITGIVCAVILVQLGVALYNGGWGNDQLYEYASGLFGNKSLAANFLYFLLIINVLLYREAPRWAVLALLTLLILVLQTRTVYLALAVSGLLYLAGRAAMDLSFRKVFFKKILPAGTVACVLMLGVLGVKGRGDSFLERVNPATYLESSTANERRFVWYKTDLLNKEHFWLGVGDGSWKLWFPSKNIDGGYRLEEQNVVFTRAHNDYLEIRSEMGMVGVVWFCSLFGLAFFAGITVFKKNYATREHRHDALVLLLGILGYCIIQFFDFPRERIEFQLIIATIFAWTIHLSNKRFFFFRPLTAMAPVFLMALGGLGLVFNLLIGWYRTTGEIHNVGVFTAQGNAAWKAVISEVGQSENPFYEYTDVAIPLAWHEGIGWYQLGQMDKSIAAFERAYKLNPWSFQVINNYATALVKGDRFREAMPLFEKALAINPSFDDGKFNLAIVHYNLGEYEKSLEWLSRVDTIANPASDEDREKNSITLQKQAEIKKAVLEKTGSRE